MSEYNRKWMLLFHVKIIRTWTCEFLTKLDYRTHSIQAVSLNTDWHVSFISVMWSREWVYALVNYMSSTYVHCVNEWTAAAASACCWFVLMARVKILLVHRMCVGVRVSLCAPAPTKTMRVTRVHLEWIHASQYTEHACSNWHARVKICRSFIFLGTTPLYPYAQYAMPLWCWRVVAGYFINSRCLRCAFLCVNRHW